MFKRKTVNEPQWDAAFEPLIKVLLSKKKGIRTRSASEVGQKKVDYFRGVDFKKFVTSNDEIMKKKCMAALKVACDGNIPENDKDVERLGSELIAKNFCYKAAYKPLNAGAKTDGVEKKVKKWPDRLGRTGNQSFDIDGFYVITYEGDKGWKRFLLALIVVGVLLICMFPAWPMWAKIGIWYLSVLFLFVYFGLLILRLIIYAAVWIIGFDFWIFPNINDEYCGFLDSFQPLYSWEKRKDDVLMLLVRFGSLGIAAVAIHQIAETHSMSDVSDFITSSYLDVLDWGVDKLTALPDVDRQALPSVDDLKREMADEALDIDETGTKTLKEAMEEDDDEMPGTVENLDDEAKK